VVDLPFVGAPDAKRNRAGHVLDDCANAVLNRVKRRIETDGHVPAADVEANAGNADLLLVGNDATDRLRVTEMAIGADNAGNDVADRHAIAHLRNRRVVVLAEHLERAVLELRGLRLFGWDRIRGVSGLPCQVLFARGVTERAPDRHRPLAGPLDSAVGVEAGFASHFPRTLLVWIGSVHALHLAIAADATLRARRFRNEPVGHGMLLVVVAPLPAFLAVEAGARPDHPMCPIR
jgi:hypothetical protein